MSEVQAEEEVNWVERGQEIASIAHNSVRSIVQSLDHKQRAQFHAGFLAHAAGCATADLGLDAINVLRGALQEAVADTVEITTQ